MAERMAAGDDLLEQVGVELGGEAGDEEGALHLVAVQHVQDARRADAPRRRSPPRSATGGGGVGRVQDERHRPPSMSNVNATAQCSPSGQGKWGIALAFPGQSEVNRVRPIRPVRSRSVPQQSEPRRSFERFAIEVCAVPELERSSPGVRRRMPSEERRGPGPTRPCAAAIHEVTAWEADTAKPGRHSDGGGHHLSISGDGRRCWVILYAVRGKQREAGLGAAGKVVDVLPAYQTASSGSYGLPRSALSKYSTPLSNSPRRS